MKKFLTIATVVLLSMMAYSCGDDCPEPDECEVPILFQVNPNILTFGANDKETQPIFVTALNVTWTAEVEASAQNWLKITEEANRVSVQAEENKTEQNRTGKITITPDNETLKPVEISVTQTLTETLWIHMNAALSVFYGDYYNCGLSNYWVNLGGGENAEFNADKGIVVTDGYKIILDMFGDDITPQDYQSKEAKTGTFYAGMDPMDPEFVIEKWSFMRTAVMKQEGRTYYDLGGIFQYAGGKFVDFIILADGKVVIEKDGENYSFVIDILNDCGQRIVMDYYGPFDAIANGVSFSTYTEDREITGLSKGTLTFQGQEATSSDSYSWVVLLQTPQIENGSEILLELCSPKTDSVILDAGTYTIQKGGKYGEYTAKYGWVGSLRESGTRVYEFNEQAKVSDFTPLIEGTIQVTHNGGDNYTITVDALMDNYLNLKGSFEGDLEYINVSSTGFAGVPYKMEDIQQIPGGNILDRSANFDLKKID